MGCVGNPDWRDVRLTADAAGDQPRQTERITAAKGFAQCRRSIRDRGSLDPDTSGEFTERRRRDRLQPTRGQNVARGLPPTLQRGPAPQQPGLSAAGPGDGGSYDALTFKTNHSAGPDQVARRKRCLAAEFGRQAIWTASVGERSAHVPAYFVKRAHMRLSGRHTDPQRNRSKNVISADTSAGLGCVGAAGARSTRQKKRLGRKDG